VTSDTGPLPTATLGATREAAHDVVPADHGARAVADGTTRAAGAGRAAVPRGA
jgi:hypothetical protein